MVALSGYGCAALLLVIASNGEPTPKLAPIPKNAAAPLKIKGPKGQTKKVLGKKAPAAALSKKRRTELDALVAKVQGYYEKMRDFRAEFMQTYTRVALSRTSESRGILYLKKPGMMRWEYQAPDKKLWIADGKQLFIFDQEYDQVIIDRNFESSRLTSSISFLWGEGKLTDSFTVALGKPTEHGIDKNAKLLLLTPKKDATYSKLALVVDPKSGQVEQSILYETSGNTNHFKFKNGKINSKVDKKLFTFTPPEGVDVTYR